MFTMQNFRFYCLIVIILPVLIECKMRKDDIKSNVRTYMYIRDSPLIIIIRNTTTNSSALENFKTMFNPQLPTKIIIHGWMSNVNRTFINGLITAYRTTTNYNVIAIDWKPISFQMYTKTIKYIVDVGEYVGDLINYLLDDLHTSHGLIHIVGHSLGAHVAGIATGRIASGKVARITGLDPAAPGVKTSECLNKRHAVLVDVIHTSGGMVAMMDNIGHADFYPNSGKASQPGCYFPPNCSHRRSIIYYTESVLNEEHTFLSHACDSWQNYQAGLCSNTTAIQMGEHTDLNAYGKYYLYTNAKAPFSMT